MCHSDIIAPARRENALASGDFSWANSVLLEARDILIKTPGGWTWNTAMFRPDGSLNDGLMAIRKPCNENCAHATARQAGLMSR
jgi:hypothetical protein